MILGRVVFGIGGESMQVAQNCLLFRWFKGREVALALGLNLSVARAGSVLNDVLSPWAARGRSCGLVGAMWLGVGLCVASCVANVLSAAIDKTEGARRGLNEATEEIVSISDVLRLRRDYWLLVLLCVALYCAILPFNNVASAYFVQTWYHNMPQAEAQQKAGNVMSLIFLVSAFGTPPFGWVVDLVGMRTHFLLFSSVLVVATYVLISTMPPAASTLCLGIVYTIFAGALWPAFALTVPEPQLGTAYGVAVALQNAGLAAVPILVGHLQAVAGEGHFGGVMRLFLYFGLVGVILSLLIWRSNNAGAGALNLPSVEAEEVSRKLCERTPLQRAPKGQQ